MRMSTHFFELVVQHRMQYTPSLDGGGVDGSPKDHRPPGIAGVLFNAATLHCQVSLGLVVGWNPHLPLPQKILFGILTNNFLNFYFVFSFCI